MKMNKWITTALVVGGSVLMNACTSIKPLAEKEPLQLPAQYVNGNDSLNIAQLSWKSYFNDTFLINLIETALNNNQELNVLLQEIAISRNEVFASKGEYLPFVSIQAGASAQKEGKYTRFGAVDEQLEIEPGRNFPQPLSDFEAGFYASWELDVWKKLRNARKAALQRYLGTEEARNFMITNLIAEIADAYYELMALDNLLSIIERNIDIQSDVLHIVEQQKEAARLSQLAVNRFKAQLLNTRNLQYAVKQEITESENHIRFLCGTLPLSIERNSAAFLDAKEDTLSAGLPSQLLLNRPDIRRAERELEASRLDVQVARAAFFPSIALNAGLGLNAYNGAHLLLPESGLYNLFGDLMGPLINRNAIKAAYWNANARQLQAVYQYEQTALKAYLDVMNQMAMIENYDQSFRVKSEQVELLRESIGIAGSLFNNARADYSEVLLTQREALESKMELIETRKQQQHARVNLYRALGGGWN
jgi:NodT family efflux transporter outer membrane factor (OMF) lipoprotein